MKDPYTISLQEGQSVIVYHNGKVLIKKTHAECRSIFTAWDSFVGTPDEVTAKIIELGLIEVKQKIPTINSNKEKTVPIPVKVPSVPKPETKGIINTITSTVSSLWNTTISIFKTNK